MSKGGVGRGRGWLNLNKNQSQNATNTPPRVGNATAGQDLTSAEESQYIDAPSSYNDLISKIQQLNTKDDGILFNQKIRYVLENWKQDCQNSEQVEKSFDRIYEGCLSDPELGTKLVMMIASRSFITQEVHDQNIRLLFLTKLQNSFEDAKQLQKTNPVIFRNSVHLLGEFYNKARLANGQQLKFMATPLLTNLKMLLDTAQLEDLKLFTTQLYLNGASLKNECPELLSEVLNSVRLTLVSDRVTSKECRLWLLLALDVASNRFGLQPAEIQKFYQEQLGDGAMADFQSTPSALSVQTPPDNKQLDSYQSAVNVLQISSPPPPPQEGATSPPHHQQHQPLPTSVPEMNNISQSSGFVSDSSTSSNRTTPSTGSKCGRPILGIGARLKNKAMNNSTTATDPNWKEPGTPGGGGGWGSGGGKKGGRTDNKRPPKGGNAGGKGSNAGGKGWEHDDRFETDYS